MFPDYPVSIATAPPLRPRARLLKDHRVAIPYPDSTRGECRYERLGPVCHLFDFLYHYFI